MEGKVVGRMLRLLDGRNCSYSICGNEIGATLLYFTYNFFLGVIHSKTGNPIVSCKKKKLCITKISALSRGGSPLFRPYGHCGVDFDCPGPLVASFLPSPPSISLPTPPLSLISQRRAELEALMARLSSPQAIANHRWPFLLFSSPLSSTIFFSLAPFSLVFQIEPSNCIGRLPIWFGTSQTT